MPCHSSTANEKLPPPRDPPPDRYPKRWPSGRLARPGAVGVVIWNPQLDKIRHGVFSLRSIGLPLLQMTEKHLHANLVRHSKIEVRSLRRKVPNKLRLGGLCRCNQRNRPRPFVRAAAPLR